MKSIFKILILAAVPILAVTAVADQALAADKGSQLIFQSNMGNQSYISVTNTNNGSAVTVLVQYYNDEMKRVLWYLRVIPGGGNVLVDPFNHEIPGTAENVSDVIGTLPAWTNDDDGAGLNSGRFVIAVTAVGANVGLDLNGDGEIADPVSERVLEANEMQKYAYKIIDLDVPSDGFDNNDITIIEYAVLDLTPDDPAPTLLFQGGDTSSILTGNGEMNRASTVNVLFPAYLAADMHGVDNIDNGGTLSLVGTGLDITNKAKNLSHDLADGTRMDTSTKNVGDLEVGNAVPIAFNHLTGNFTEALTSTASGGADQTASWGGTPIIRPAVSDTANGMHTYSNAEASDAAERMVYMMGDYYALDGMNSMPVVNAVEIEGEAWISLDDASSISTGVTAPETLPEVALPAATLATDFDNEAVKGIRGGRLAEKDAGGSEVKSNETGSDVNRGLSGGALVLPALYGGSAEQTHQVMLFLSAADDFGGAGSYSLMAAKTKYTVIVHDNMGNILSDPAEDRVFGGAGGTEIASIGIIVEGIGVMTDAGACGGEMVDGDWTLAHLTGLVPVASSGTGKFAGLDAMLDPAKNVSPGFIKFVRAELKCTKDYGDDDSTDERTYKGGTLIVEKDADRAFVTTGQALLKYLTPNATFAASWSLKSPPSPAN